MSLPELRAGRTQSGKQHEISSFGIFSDCHATPWHYVAPEQMVLIEMPIPGLCCCLPRAVKATQQFQDSCTGMVWLEYLSPARHLFLPIFAAISHRELSEQEWKGGSMESLLLTVYLFFQKDIAIMLPKLYSKTL